MGGTFALTGIFLSSFTKEIYLYLILYCLMNGVGCGMCYFVPLVCGWEYFPHKKGLVTGCILAGYGFSSFIFSLISTKLVNPNHENPTIEDPDTGVTYYDSDVADRTPFMIRILVLIWAVCVFVSVLLITRPEKIRTNLIE